MSNKIAHVELASSDRAASAKFYGDLFGWPVQRFEVGDYLMTALPRGETSMAFVQEGGPWAVTPGSVLVFVDVADVDATIARARQLGATILSDKTEVPNTGWMAMIGDPGGNRIAVLQRIP
jgi:hypothetical protein